MWIKETIVIIIILLSFLNPKISFFIGKGEGVCTKRLVNKRDKAWWWWIGGSKKAILAWHNYWIIPQWKHLESWVFPFGTVLKYSNDISFTIWCNRLAYSGNHSSFKILQLFDTWRCQTLVKQFLVLLWFNLKWITWCLSCIAAKSSFTRNVIRLTRLTR